MQPRFKTREQAVGRWRSILTELDVPAQYLTGKHGPCPCCGGKMILSQIIERASWLRPRRTSTPTLTIDSS